MQLPSIKYREGLSALPHPYYSSSSSVLVVTLIISTTPNTFQFLCALRHSNLVFLLHCSTANNSILQLHLAMHPIRQFYVQVHIQHLAYSLQHYANLLFCLASICTYFTELLNTPRYRNQCLGGQRCTGSKFGKRGPAVAMFFKDKYKPL